MKSRWFECVVDRFDFIPRPGVMILFRRGMIGYGNAELFRQAGSRVKRIKRPDGYMVGKDGKAKRRPKKEEPGNV